MQPAFRALARQAALFCLRSNHGLPGGDGHPCLAGCRTAQPWLGKKEGFMAEELRGAPVAKKITSELAGRAEALKERGVTPTLAFVRVGERPDDLSYQHAAEKRCAKVGIETKLVELPAEASQEEIEEAISSLNSDDSVHGCLLFRPLPKAIDEARIASIMAPAKDVDGITPGSLYGVFAGEQQGFPPCTAAAVMALIDHYGIALEGARVTVVGRSLVVGRPLSMLLLARNATVTLCHSRTKDLFAATRQADIVVSAAGRAHMLTRDAFRPGQTVIDVGMNWSEAEGRFVGDVATDEICDIAEACTPVPGGVGSVTTAILAQHTIEAAERTLA